MHNVLRKKQKQICIGDSTTVPLYIYLSVMHAPHTPPPPHIYLGNYDTVGLQLAVLVLLILMLLLLLYVVAAILVQLTH